MQDPYNLSWSDAAREAAIAARQGRKDVYGEKAESYTEAANHASSKANKGDPAFGGKVSNPEKHDDAHEAHTLAAAKHGLAAEKGLPENKEYHQTMEKYHNARAERHAQASIYGHLDR